MCFFLQLFRSIYPVGKHFFVLQTIDHARHYKPENKIVIDIPAAVNIFYHPDRIEQHITHVATELLDKWNATFVNKPQVKKTPKICVQHKR